MTCNDFDAYIDEMLSGVLHPDANQHMRQCERCTSHYRARAAVQNGLRHLALAPVPGPSPAADRAVMDAFRQLQQRRGAAHPQAVPQMAAKVLTFPERPAPARSSRLLKPRTWWNGASAAAVVLAMLGMGLHLRNGVTTVNSPTLAKAPVVAVQQSSFAAAPAERTVATAKLVSRRSLRPTQSPAPQPRVVEAVQVDSAASEVASSSAPATQLPLPAPSGTSPIMHLASAGTTQNVAESASSTWPGYSNLMYCDPVVCSGPMQVVHIKVPVGQVKPNVGQSEGNSFVNADVVVGPDGVARAIRVAN